MELCRHVDTSSCASFVRDLERLYRTMKAPDRYVTLDGRTRFGLRYVQAIVTAERSVMLESIADAFLEPSGARLAPAGELALGELGFEAPSARTPNWSLELSVDLPGWTAMLAEVTMRTFVDVHGWRPGIELVGQAGLCLCSPEDLMQYLLPSGGEGGW